MAINKRNPPAFQCYASDEQASEKNYSLTLPERGLLHSMRCAIWVNGSISKDPRVIALAIRSPLEEVQPALTQRVLEHFETDPRDPQRLVSRELENQRTNLLERRANQSQGGRVGATKTNATRWHAAREKPGSGRTSGDLSAQPSTSGRVVSRVEANGTETNRPETPSLGRNDEVLSVGDPPTLSRDHETWVSEYDGARGQLDAQGPHSSDVRAGTLLNHGVGTSPGGSAANEFQRSRAVWERKQAGKKV